MSTPQLIDLLDSLESAGPERAREFWEPKAEAPLQRGRMTLYDYYRTMHWNTRATVTTDPIPIVWTDIPSTGTLTVTPTTSSGTTTSFFSHIIPPPERHDPSHFYIRTSPVP